MVPLVDAHHHIWRQADLAWLHGPPQPRIFGEYEAIRRDYPIEEYMAEAGVAGVVRSVYVQTNWPLGREVDEVGWAQGVADRHGSRMPSWATPIWPRRASGPPST